MKNPLRLHWRDVALHQWSVCGEGSKFLGTFWTPELPMVIKKVQRRPHFLRLLRRKKQSHGSGDRWLSSVLHTGPVNLPPPSSADIFEGPSHPGLHLFNLLLSGKSRTQTQEGLLSKPQHLFSECTKYTRVIRLLVNHCVIFGILSPFVTRLPNLIKH